MSININELQVDCKYTFIYPIRSNGGGRYGFYGSESESWHNKLGRLWYKIKYRIPYISSDYIIGVEELFFKNEGHCDIILNFKEAEEHE